MANNYQQNSKMQNRINAVNKNKEQIVRKVNSEHISATEEEARIINSIVDKVSGRFAEKIAQYGNTPEVLAEIRKAITNEAMNLDVPYESKLKIDKIAKETVGLGPIEPFLSDDTVTEIVVQRYDQVFIERNGVVEQTSVKFNDEDHLKNVINKIVEEVGRSVNISTPIVDARLRDGSRVNATISPVTPDGATLTVRKFSKEKMTAKDYLKFNSIDERMLHFCEKCVEGKISVFISGGTGTGKTTFLNMLSNYIPKNELIVTIEDTCELQIQSERVRRMETRPGTSEGLMNVDIAMCVKNALRMRPDRIIVGEIRDGAVVDLLTALSTGHDGGLSTGHANSPQNLINTRLPILYGMNKDVKLSENAQKIQFSEAIQLIIQLKRFPNGARKVVEVTEISGIDKNGDVILNPIFVYDEINEKFMPTGYVPERIINKCNENKVKIDTNIFNEDIAFEVSDDKPQAGQIITNEESVNNMMENNAEDIPIKESHSFVNNKTAENDKMPRDVNEEFNYEQMIQEMNSGNTYQNAAQPQTLQSSIEETQNNSYVQDNNMTSMQPIMPHQNLVNNSVPEQNSYFPQQIQPPYGIQPPPYTEQPLQNMLPGNNAVRTNCQGAYIGQPNDINVSAQVKSGNIPLCMPYPDQAQNMPASNSAQNIPAKQGYPQETSPENNGFSMPPQQEQNFNPASGVNEFRHRNRGNNRTGFKRAYR